MNSKIMIASIAGVILIGVAVLVSVNLVPSTHITSSVSESQSSFATSTISAASTISLTTSSTTLSISSGSSSQIVAPLTATVYMIYPSSSCVGPVGYFSPESVTVAVDGTVTWSNQATEYHDVVVDNTTSPDIPPGGSWSLTFTSAGTFNYYDSLSSMTGTVIVQP